MQNISWKTLEFEKRERSGDWVWAVGLIAILAAVISFFYNNIFFGIFLIVSGAVVIIYALKHPKELLVEINEKGVSINGDLLEYKDIKAFWLDESGKDAKLLLLTKNSFVPTVSIPLFGVSAAQIRESLAPNAKEEELRESRSVALFDKIGF